MVKIITVRSNGEMKAAIAELKRIRTRVINITKKTMLKWGKILEKDLKNTARQAGIKPFTGTLFSSGIRYDQRPNGNVGHLFIRNYGIKLDGMKTHYVNVHRRRTVLLAWARQAKQVTIRKKALDVTSKNLKKFTIIVEKKSFIRKGFNRARPKLTQLLKRDVSLAVNA